MFDEPSLKSFQISVKTYKDIVQLSGFVDSAQSGYRHYRGDGHQRSNQEDGNRHGHDGHRN